MTPRALAVLAVADAVFGAERDELDVVGESRELAHGVAIGEVGPEGTGAVRCVDPVGAERSGR